MQVQEKRQEIYLLSILLMIIVIGGFISVKWVQSEQLLEWLKSLGSGLSGALFMLIRSDSKNESIQNINSGDNVVTMENTDKQKPA